MTNNDVKIIESFEMWCWRKMLKIKWTEMKRNDDILMQIGVKREIMERIKYQQHKWIGHNLRGESMLKMVLEGRFEGKKTPGRPRIQFMDTLMNGKSYGELKKIAQDRNQWLNWKPWTRTCQSRQMTR